MDKIDIPKMIQALRNSKKHTFWIVCLLCLSLGEAPTALAEYKKPPGTRNDAPREESTTMTGIRGKGSCSEQSKTKLTALAPYSYPGQSTNDHPIFAWHIPDPEPYPLLFRLYEYDTSQRNGKGKIIAKEKRSSSPGIMTYALQSDSPGLSVGQKYIWEVIVMCNPNSPSQSLVVGAEINVVNRPTEIITELNNTGDADRVKKVDIYARAGLWYDALTEVVSIPNKTLISKLIGQLAVVEEPNHASELKNIVQTLTSTNGNP